MHLELCPTSLARRLPERHLTGAQAAEDAIDKRRVVRVPGLKFCREPEFPMKAPKPETFPLP